MVMRAPEPTWTIDPDDPRAPPDEIWDAMSPEERKRIVASLPSEFPLEAFPPPEGDPHFNAKVGARDVLGGYFTRIGRRVYIGCELPVYYPGEKMFAPDVMAVLDVDTHERQSWVVRDEGRGLDFALEILVRGDREKDLRGNVERYAKLGIAEYFVFDRGRLRLTGHRLPSPGARAYRPILAQAGFYSSHVLGLDLRIEGTRLRFYHAAMALPDSNELIRSLERMIDDVEARQRDAEEHAAEEARQRAEAEHRLAEAERKLAEVERKLAEAQAEIERLKAGRRRR